MSMLPLSWESDPMGALAPLTAMGSSSMSPMPNVTPVYSPAAAAASPSFMGLQGVSTAQGINGILGGIQSLGNLWAAFQSAKLAKKQFKFTKDITNTNLRNQIQSYNTALTDRITSRAHTQGMSQDEARSYLNTHSLRR
jgi:hypothetical protein